MFTKDWTFDPWTATPLDRQPIYAHPVYGLPATMCNLWGNRLLFGGTEVAAQFGGYLEGALEAAEMVGAQLLGHTAANNPPRFAYPIP